MKTFLLRCLGLGKTWKVTSKAPAEVNAPGMKYEPLITGSYTQQGTAGQRACTLRISHTMRE